MNTTITKLNGLFDTDPEPEAKPTAAYRLWFMPGGRRTGWSVIAETATEYEAVSAMADHRTGGHGRYMILPASQTP